MALVVTVKEESAVWIGHDVRITVGRHQHNGTQLIIEAPQDVKILREELGRPPVQNKSIISLVHELRSLLPDQDEQSIPERKLAEALHYYEVMQG